jgi:hypothetical protein
MRLGLNVGAGVIAGLLLLGCGDSGGGTNSASNSNSDSQGSASTGSTSEGTMSGTMGVTEASLSGGMSASGTGTTTDQSGSMSDSQTQGGGSDGTDGMTSGTTGTASEGGSGGTTVMTTEPQPETTGEPVDCKAAQTKAECVMLGCQPVEGQGFEFDGAIWCLNDNFSYLGCIEPMGCAEVISYSCKGQNKYQLPNACAPDGFMTCEPPPDPGMDGWPAC